LIDLPVSNVNIKEFDEVLWGAALFLEEGKQTAIFAADCTSRSLQSYSVVLPDSTIAPHEFLNGRNKRVEAVGIKVETTGGPGLKMNC
jgi:hypothetical protein